MLGTTYRSGIGAAAGLLGLLATPAIAFVSTPNPVDADLLKCQRTMTKETTKATSAVTKVLGKALDAGVKDFHTLPDITPVTEVIFETSLRKIRDSRELGKSIEEKATEKIVVACDPSTHAFTNEDLLDLPGKTAEASIRGKSLEPLAGTTDDAPPIIDSVAELATFMVKTATNEAIRPVMSSSPNSPEVIERLKQKIGVKAPPVDDPTRITDITNLLLKMKHRVDPDDDDDLNPIATSTSSSTTTSSTTSTTVFVPNVCGNCVWDGAEACDPCSPQAGPGCLGNCTCNPFDICNFF